MTPDLTLAQCCLLAKWGLKQEASGPCWIWEFDLDHPTPILAGDGAQMSHNAVLIPTEPELRAFVIDEVRKIAGDSTFTVPVVYVGESAIPSYYHARGWIQKTRRVWDAQGDTVLQALFVLAQEIKEAK
jgi:hypothetical protein